MESTPTGAIKHFTDLRVWQKARDLFVSIYREVESMPRETTASYVADQVLICAGNISAHIAAGFYRVNAETYVRKLEVAYCSAVQTESRLYELLELKIVKEDIVNPWLDMCVGIEKMLHSFMKKLRDKNKS
ncbi:hypothetical protein AMJ83_00510 [candidate division WOR_3 bacterium SM23_42]|uniref:Four helix bundle protein n=1 Tax=candidate division WOR_3 bacterium SM23_42 TaxID=1703779 RepID=A0A0S8FVM0_UNCW3|nr:MAG: hypothetical protein AMJ83_00510 [candidate division WOR_3 bacterium SM23_42]